MRTLLCAIGRMENEYIREWVEYNKNIGFTNICLFDNNYDGEQDFRDVIGDYIESGYVILKDYRNKSLCQIEAYTECYTEYGNEYDWLAFFDCDEFITLMFHNNISDYLSDKMFDEFYVIKLNWALYGDNDMLYNDGRPLTERFKYPIPTNKPTHNGDIESRSTKSIVRGSQKIKTNENDNGFVFLDAHLVNLCPACNNAGKEVLCTERMIPTTYEYAYLRHYSTKTAREYCNKIRRGYPDIFGTYYRDINGYLYLIENIFFTVNNITSEKIQIFKDVLGADASYLLNN